jgi:hypothetical protein
VRTTARADREPWSIDTGKLTMLAAFSGLVAVLPMTLFLYVTPIARLPSVHVPNLLASLIAGAWPYWTEGPVLMGWITHFAMGIGIAIAYAWLVLRRKPQAGALGGAAFALVGWLFMELVVFPILGFGVFGSRIPQGVGVAFVSFVGYVIYGAIMGGLLREFIERTAIPVIGPFAQPA